MKVANEYIRLMPTGKFTQKHIRIETSYEINDEQMTNEHACKNNQSNNATNPEN